MIPKIIHYCWFGRGQLDAKALKCIESWKKYFPDYEIIQWNEDNFDISSCDFMFKAYADKKWAFVSDVARLMIIYEHGGIYFDTDVEVIRPYDDIVTSDADGFIGLESTMQVASGLGFGAKKQTPFLKELLSVYNSLSYDDYKNDLSSIACTIITTSLMKEKGFSGTNQLQRVAGFDIYPIDYFSPIEYHTGKLRKTSNTHSIH